MSIVNEFRQTIGHILDGFCENRADADLLPAVELLKTCHERLPADSDSEFFEVLAGRLQSEPISFPGSAGVCRSSHILIVRAWAAFGPADALPELLFSMLKPDTRESMESWALMIGAELLISLSLYGTRFSDAALKRIKGECTSITSDQEMELTDSGFPPALVGVAQRLENLVKDIEFKRNVVEKLRPPLNATGPSVAQWDATRNAGMDTAPGEAWKRFDQSLFELKLREPSREMHEETESRWRKVQFERRQIGQGEGIGLFLALADSDLVALREFLEKDVDRICREVWRAQGNSVTADFVRTVLLRTVLNTMEVRIASIKWGIEEMAKRQGSSEDLFPVRTHLVQATDQLKFILGNRYEIEARELEYKKAPLVRDAKKAQRHEKALIEALGESVPALASRKSKIGLNPDHSLFAPAPHSWISRAGPGRDNQSDRRHKAAVGKTREASLRPILEKKGFSVRAWAREASVDFHTADNYLKGKTQSRPDTLKSLAQALGVTVKKLKKLSA